MTRDRLPWLLFALTFVVLLAQRACDSSAVRVARAESAIHEERADFHEARADSLHEVSLADSARADSTAIVNEGLASKLDTLTALRVADSTAAEAERREDRSRVTQATVTASEALDSLLAHADSIGAVHAATYVAARDSIDAAKDRENVRLNVELGSTKGELAGAHERIDGLVVEVGDLRAAAMSARAEASAERETSASLRNAVRSLRSGLDSAGRQNRLLKLGGVGLLGLAVYDRIKGG